MNGAGESQPSLSTRPRRRDRPSRWRRWSPWRLRAELRFMREVLHEERTMMPDADSNTLVERLYRHAALTLIGYSDPWQEASRYSVSGMTLHIDATDDRLSHYTPETIVGPPHFGGDR